MKARNFILIGALVIQGLIQARLLCAVALGIGSSGLAAAAGESAGTTPAKTSIPWSQIGAKAGADYQGDGLTVAATAEGARLHCVFQRLEGQATREGLWLTSTVTNGVNDRFRVMAAEVARVAPSAPGAVNIQHPTSNIRFEDKGTVAIDGQRVRFTRPGLMEEYSVSMDGVRQDFVVLERPAGVGELAVQLAVSGARVEPAAGGARLVLENSEREIAYSRLRVTDVTGKELRSRIEVIRRAIPSGLNEIGAELGTMSSSATSALALVVVLNDADAVYPVRIDPTFSDANWISMNPSIPGADREVEAAVVDGSGNLCIAGHFTVVGDVIANNIAKWNGTGWSALGSGISGPYYGGFVLALAVSGNDLYAAGDFTTAGGIAATNIARWNGSSWSALGSGIKNEVYALAVSGSDLYAGSDFIAKWNGSTWTALGSGMDGGVYALAASGRDLYAGGRFTTAGGIATANIARWNGSNWSALGSGIGAPSGGPDSGGSVNALAVSGSDVYAGGYFTTAGGSAANGIAKWNGSSWSVLGSGMNGGVRALAVSGSDLYAGGDFIAKWNGSTWTALGSGMGGRGYKPEVTALAASGSDLYAGGDFDMAGGSPANCIAKWNGSSWSALGSGMGSLDPPVYALAASGSDVYVGGNFTTAGSSPANCIAKWNGSSWSALGSGISGPYYGGSVLALAVSGSDLYAAGDFTTAGGIAATNIAKWNGSSWSALGSGMGGGDPDTYVDALAVSGSDLYAGGEFTTAGGSAANYIAKWDGSSWLALGSGMGGNSHHMSALAVSGSNVYAGGQFTTAGGIAAANIAKWNGSSWSALGSGIGDGFAWVYALAVSGSNVYAGGQFTTAGGIAAINIAKWNGSSWSALGSGIGSTYPDVSDSPVYALAVSGSDLYAGGVFTTAGGNAANYIAKWDGSRWSALGSGLGGGFSPYVCALAMSGSDLYAGGGFTTAGGKVSAYLARAIVNPPVLAIEGNGNRGYFIRFSGVPGSAYRLERAPGLAGPWTASATQAAPASGLVEFWDLFPTPAQGFYRAVSH